MYRLQFTNDNKTRNNYRKILLLVAIACDIANLFALLETIFTSLVWLSVVLSLFVLSCTARYFSRRTSKTFDYVLYDDTFKITLAIPYKSKQILQINCLKDSFNLQKIGVVDKPYLKESKDLRMLCFFCCELDYYMLEFDSKKFVVCLDDYMFALLDSYKKIGKSDD